MKPPPGHTRAELVACVEREVKMRVRVYGERVAMAKMTRAFADKEIAAMRAVLEVVKQIEEVPAAQTGLFG